MNNKRLIELIKFPSSSSPKEKEELLRLCEEYPYCAFLKIIHAKIAKINQDNNLNKYIGSAAIASVDRTNLQHFMMAEDWNVSTYIPEQSVYPGNEPTDVSLKEKALESDSRQRETPKPEEKVPDSRKIDLNKDQFTVEAVAKEEKKTERKPEISDKPVETDQEDAKSREEPPTEILSEKKEPLTKADEDITISNKELYEEKEKPEKSGEIKKREQPTKDKEVSEPEDIQAEENDKVEELKHDGGEKKIGEAEKEKKSKEGKGIKKHGKVKSDKKSKEDLPKETAKAEGRKETLDTYKEVKTKKPEISGIEKETESMEDIRESEGTKKVEIPSPPFTDQTDAQKRQDSPMEKEPQVEKSEKEKETEGPLASDLLRNIQEYRKNREFFEKMLDLDEKSGQKKKKPSDKKSAAEEKAEGEDLPVKKNADKSERKKQKEIKDKQDPSEELLEDTGGIKSNKPVKDLTEEPGSGEPEQTLADPENLRNKIPSDVPDKPSIEQPTGETESTGYPRYEEEDPKVIKSFLEKLSRESHDKVGTPKRLKKEEQVEIIENFIKSEPKIKNIKEAQALREREDLSLPSVRFKDDIVSENLATILKNQGKIEEAIDIYKKLIWKFPQKKTYFASQIEELKKKLGK